MSLNLIPQPKKISTLSGKFILPSTGAITIASQEFYPVAAQAQSLFPRYSINAAIPKLTDPLTILKRKNLKNEEYRLAITPSGVKIEAAAPAGAFYALQTLRQIADQSPAGTLPCLDISDWPDFQDRGVYYDVCRGRVPTLERLLQLADTLAQYKINQLQLYIEHTFLFRGHPDIGKGASPLSAEDILELDAYCRELHIELVPSLASFGHLATVLCHPQYHDLAEDWGVGKFLSPDAPVNPWLKAWTLSPANPKIYGFLDSLFSEFLPLFSSKRFNICCDETWDLGWGQSYEMCRKLGKGNVYLGHIARVNQLCRKYGKKVMFWGDIIRHYPELITKIPKDVTVLDWGYAYNHPFEKISDFKKAGLEFIACPGTSSWVALFPRLPEACANIAGFAAAAFKNGARGVLNTDWGDGGHYNFMEYSWHGYLFGAEQSWNTQADQSSFTKRFTQLFLGSGDPALAKALTELGEVSFLNVEGCYQSVWQTVLFAAPGDSVFQRTAPTNAIVCRNGTIKPTPIHFDARFGRETMERLAAVRAVFAAHAGQRGEDSLGVLPYWLFAVDTIATAARRLAAYGPGGKATPVVRKSLRRDLISLKARFQKLWLARNRPSEIQVTLDRYDRVIHSLNTWARFTEVAPGKLRLSVTNTGDSPVSGTYALTVIPEELASIAGRSSLRIKNLKPGATISALFAYTAKPGFPRISITAQPTGNGLALAHLAMHDNSLK